MDLNKLTMGQVLGSLPLMRDRLYLGEDGRGHGSRHGPQHDTLVEELWVDRRSSRGGQPYVCMAGHRYLRYGVGAGNVVPAIAPHTHEDQTCGVDGHWAHEDQTLPSGQLGSVNSISVGLSQRSSHFESHPKYLIRNQPKSLSFVLARLW